MAFKVVVFISWVKYIGNIYDWLLKQEKILENQFNCRFDSSII